MTSLPFLRPLITLVLLVLASVISLAPAPADDTVHLAPPSDAPARAAAFAVRDSAASVDKLGRELFKRTYIGVWDPHEFNRPGRWAALKEVRARMDRNDFSGALDVYKNGTMERLRSIDGEGLPRGRFDPFSSGAEGVQWIRPLLSSDQQADTVKQANEMMTGVISVNGKKLDIGPPGTVNWKAAVATANRGAAGWPWDLDAFYPLLAAYIFTGQQSYMDKWAAYVDDWAMNQPEGVGTSYIADVPDQWANGVETMLTLLRYLGGVVAVPNGAASLPSPTFARVFLRLVDDFIPVSILYHRSNPQNWNDSSLTALPDIGYFLDDYPIGRQLLHEARRRVDLLPSTHHMLDGPDLDTTVGYANLFIIGTGTFLNRIDTRQMRLPDWMLTPWEKEDWRYDPGLALWEQNLRTEMIKRARFLAAHTLANGEWPIGGTRDGRHNESQRVYDTLRYFIPEAFQNPDIAGIMAISTGRTGSSLPSFTSERFPLSGLSYIRAGWKPNDPYMFFYCAPQPMGGSLSWRNNNAVGLGAFGYDLLETGENGVYDQPHTPVRVDGLEQFFQFGIPAWGHRGAMLTTSVYQTPPAWRWHDSPQFTVAEGVYAGNFGKEKKLDDVRHQRLVHFARDAGVWIVTDRLQSPQTHEYTLDWRFGIKPGDERDFTADQVTVPANSSVIKTARADGANVSLYHFASSPLTFTTGEERTPPQGYRLHDFLRVSADWKAQGQSVVVTAIYPRQTEAEELTKITSLNAPGAEGFEAVTPKGYHVLYQAATIVPGRLKVEDLSAEGESLLLTIGPDGVRRGVALGCKSLRVAGKPATVPVADFEFTLAGGTLKTTPIRTPLAPVQIGPPDTTAFVGRQTVTLACATPHTEIRYTLDGSEPTPASPLYRGPITLMGSAEVKARSLRPGVTRLPSTVSGTMASVVTQAMFVAATPAKAVTAPATLPGLHFDYYEGRWQDLLSGLDHMTPVKSGEVGTLFDVSPKGDVSTYAFRYSGYFEAPADGVYNFQAPPEFYQPNIMAGYDLRLLLDGKEWYPATSRHALGTWSVALQKGQHDFQVVYADLRGDGVQKMNKPGQKPLVWEGTTPDVQLSGPGLSRRSLSALSFSHAK